MEANPSKFPCEVIENMRNYMFSKGFLKDDIQDQVEENLESERKWETQAEGSIMKIQ